ncbi:MAG TPA: hypothetical protein PK514_07240 [Spirochaetota bacterium]|nr:hypothetical protein [Spirochaetota bacterium]
MKKLILAIITLSIITYTGCYDPDTATVRINLGNIPIAKHEPKSFIDRILGLFEKEAYAQTTNAENAGVDVVHVAAYSGNSVIATASIDAHDVANSALLDVNGSYVELSVPAGEDITFLVVGQSVKYVNDSPAGNYAAYMGLTKQSINAGETANVNVSVFTLTGVHGTTTDTWSSLINFNVDYQETYNRLYWERQGFPVKFQVYSQVWNDATYLYDDGEKIYEDYGQSVDITEGYVFGLYIYFESFDLKSDEMELNFG